MKVLFLLYVISVDHQGYESLNRYDSTEYTSKAQCEKSLKAAKVKKNQSLFCGEDYLYFKK